MPHRTLLWSVLLLLCLNLAPLMPLAHAAEQEPPSVFLLELMTATSAPLFSMPADEEGEVEPARPAERNLYGRAIYPHAAVPPIFVTVPADLALPDNRLLLHLPPPDEAPPPPPPGDAPPEPVEPTGAITRLYWHPDQAQGPVVETVTNQNRRPAPDAAGADAADLPFAAGLADEIPLAARGQGDYTLNTGGLTMRLDGFLPPLEMVSPASIRGLDPNEGLLLQWQPVPGARAYLLHALGMSQDEEGREVYTIWVSSTVEPPERLRYGEYGVETTLQDDLEQGLLLPATTTECRVPAGLFPDAGLFLITVTAIGNDVSREENGVTFRAAIRSEWSAMQIPGLELLFFPEEDAGPVGGGEEPVG